MPDIEPVGLTAEDVRRALLEEAKRYPQHRIWEAWEDDLLREFHRKLPYHVLAEKLGRTVSMVSHRLENLGLTKQHSRQPIPAWRRNGSAKDRRTNNRDHAGNGPRSVRLRR